CLRMVMRWRQERHQHIQRSAPALALGYPIPQQPGFCGEVLTAGKISILIGHICRSRPSTEARARDSRTPGISRYPVTDDLPLIVRENAEHRCAVAFQQPPEAAVFGALVATYPSVVLQRLDEIFNLL